MRKKPLTRRDFLQCMPVLTAAGAGCLSSCSTGQMQADQPIPLSDRLFVMDTFFWDNGLDAEKQAELLKQVNHFKGTDCRNDWVRFPRVLETFDRHGIEMAAVYLRLSADPPAPPFVAPLMKSLQGRNTLIWLNPAIQKYKPSDPAGDPAALALIQYVSDVAGVYGLPVSLYHHRGEWMERISDTYRLALNSRRDNVGCTFNLYHWLCTDDPERLEQTVSLVMPKLNCVTINGTMKNAAQLDVRKAILPLGQGDYDVENFVQTLMIGGYNGPFGLQGYGIGGDIKQKLSQSLLTWENMCGRMLS